MNDALYQALISRHSTRRFDTHPLADGTLKRIQDLAATVEPLVPENRYAVMIRDVNTVEDLVQALGAYGRLLSPPHFMVPYILGETHPLEDLGYRTQQLVIQMMLLDLGACYIGSLGRETTLRARFILRREARIGAVLIFGHPAEDLGNRTADGVLRRMAGSTHRLSAAEIFYNKSFDHPGVPPEELVPLIEAARRSPSALNAQPWRFLWRKGELFLFTLRQNARYGKGVPQDYRFFDAGLCMASVRLALKSQGRQESWQLLTGEERDLPKYPQTLAPVAKIVLG
ncbi:MAG: nitroreductase family protein [Anaerolineae bacterium]|nr:nitroreductase family protein [Anaerolineae bacterium]